jgi:hypothetical protein
MLNLRTKKSNAPRFWNTFKEWASRTNTGLTPVDRLEFEVNQILSRYFSGVYANIKINVDGKYELMFTVEGIPRHFTKVFEILDNAPEMELWTWQAFRPKDRHLKKVTHQGSTLNLDDAYFEYAKDRAKLGIKVYIRGFRPEADQELICFRLIDRFIGELEVYKKIKWIDLQPLDEDLIFKYFPLSYLPKIIEGYDLEINN